MIKLPKNLLTQSYTKPKVFLCEVNKAIICELETTNLQGNFKFNSYSEISFTVSRMYTNLTTGKTSVNPFYDKIEALRLIYLEGFGYFEIQDPEIVSDGIQEVKNITAYSLEYVLSQKYLEEFNINTGTVNSVEVMYQNGPLVPVTLYNKDNKQLSLTHIISEKMYGWEFDGRQIDETLKTMSRTFEISRVSIYDFIMQDICDQFNCYAVFDTVNNKIELHAETLISRFIGDGETTSFTISPVYDPIGTVSIDTYKTTEYQYVIHNPDGIVNRVKTATLTFNTPPKKGAIIEVTDASQKDRMTDVYISFQNLAQEVNVSYSADNIKTVLTVKGADDLDISEVNMGLSYLVDLSYYYSADWMGEELFDAYTKYLRKCEASQATYTDNAASILELDAKIKNETYRTSLQYKVAEYKFPEVGTYYIKGADPITGYDVYSEVQLPKEYNANMVYYTLKGSNINETKFSNLHKALQQYCKSKDDKDVSGLEDIKEEFNFLEVYTIDYLITQLSAGTQVDTAILNVFNEIWQQLGYKPLQDYYTIYNNEKTNAESQGWNDPSHEQYWQYYPMLLASNSLSAEIDVRETLLDGYNDAQTELKQANKDILAGTLMDNNFSDAQMRTLSAFLREDEYTDDNFFLTDYNTIDEIIQTKQELLECGRIELQKLCSPKLEFSMDMANIYALPEFAPMINQFQLGRLITVELRKDYIKRARLLRVDFDFEDFSNFSCEFGELTSLRTPSSIHADLLSTALTAGKSVASNASYWNRGTSIATSTDLKIQQGLLSTNGLYTSDQTVVIDDDGIRLRKVNADGSFSPYQAWIKNNTILLSSDGFKEGSVAELGLGEFTVDGETFYGILAKVIMSGYIEGSTIVGGTINIGDGAFMVYSDGTVVMNGANTISGYAKEEDVNDLQGRATIISSAQPTEANEGQLWLNTSIEPYELMVFTNGEWVYFAQQDGQKIYTSQPSEYTAGDLWVLAEGEVCTIGSVTYKYGNILKANDNLEWEDATPEITKTLSNIDQYFEFNTDSGLKIGQKDEKFYVNISSTRMSFYDKSDGEDATEQERDPDEVVYISNKSAVMKKLVVEDDATFESPATFKQEVNMLGLSSGFTWKIESNGSLSLAIQS